MAKISITDLADSMALDHEAMAAIVGGARTSGSRGTLVTSAIRSNRIVDYPPRAYGDRLSPSLPSAVNKRSN